MTTIVTRAGKGLALTYDEMDSNFTNLNTAKLEAGTAATNIANTPTGNIVATNVQAAINELDTEKVNTVNPTTSGTLTHTGQNINVVSTSGMLQLNGTNLLPFGTNTQEWAYRLSAGGTADALTASLGVEMLSYRPGIRLSIYPVGANTVVAPTLALNGLAAKTIKKIGATGKIELVIGDYNQFLPMQLEYDGTDFVLLNPLYSGAAGTQLQRVFIGSAGASTASTSWTNMAQTHGVITPKSTNSMLVIKARSSVAISAAAVNTEVYLTLSSYAGSYTNIGSTFNLRSLDYTNPYMQYLTVTQTLDADVANTTTTAKEFSIRGSVGNAAVAVTLSNILFDITEVQK